MAHSKGRGWHGDPEGHARAGRIGGLKSRKPANNNFGEQIMMGLNGKDTPHQRRGRRSTHRYSR